MESLALLASSIAGAATFAFAFLLLDVAIRSRAVYRSKIWAQEYEEKQLNEIRNESWVFRNFEVLVREIDGIAAKNKARNDQLEHALFFLEKTPTWTVSLFVATTLTSAFLVSILASLFLMLFFGWLSLGSLLTGIAIGFYYQFLAISSVESSGMAVKERVIRRLPFVVDLMALVRRANAASFAGSLKIVADENANHPIGAIFARSYVESNSLEESVVLDNLSKRMRDASFDEVNKTIVNADAMGRPVAEALSQLAKTMRLKRQQWGEEACGKAQTKIIVPGIVVMCGCLATIVTPFILSALFDAF